MDNQNDGSPRAGVYPGAGRSQISRPHATQAQSTIGNVVAASGARLTIAVDTTDGRDAPTISIGDMMRTGLDGARVFALTSDIETIIGNDGRAQMMIHAELLGEVDANGVFERGVTRHPAIGTPIYQGGDEDVATLYEGGGGDRIRIGTIVQNAELPAYADIDNLLSRHFAFLGSSGSGKSTGVALLLRAILASHQGGHVVLLDPHAEYGGALADIGETVDITALHLPCWLLNLEEMVGIMVPPSETFEREIQIAILKDVILEAKINYAGQDKDVSHITVDTPVPYRTGDLSRLIDRAMTRPNRPTGVSPYLRLIERLEHLERDRRYNFMFSGFLVRDELPGLISRILRIPVAGKPLTILDLSGVPTEIVEVVVSVLCRMVFDFVLWSDHARTPPILLICEEAHRYVPNRRGEGFDSTRRAISRIAKEGRKYGVSLGLVSQRPSELDPTILSQCGTIFAFRLSNEIDQKFVDAALPENAHGLSAELPALRRQEAIVVGEGVRVAMRVRFDDVEEARRPQVTARVFSSAWQNDDLDEDFVADAVERWRQQTRQGRGS